MMRATMGRSNPAIEQAVKSLITEDYNFDRQENRSAHRERLVRPVQVELRADERTIPAFSRNISVNGIGIISAEAMLEKSTAILEIGGIKNMPVKILAECRWSRGYGENWYISGWQFISIKR